MITFMIKNLSSLKETLYLPSNDLIFFLYSHYPVNFLFSTPKSKLLKDKNGVLLIIISFTMLQHNALYNFTISALIYSVCCCLLTMSCLTLLGPQGRQPTRLLCLWDFLGKNTGVGCHCLLQRIFPGIETTSPAWQADSLPLTHRGSPIHPIKAVLIFY